MSIRRDPKEKKSSEQYVNQVIIEMQVKKTISEIMIKKYLVWTCIGIIIFSVFATYCIIIAFGIGKLPSLPESFLHWLGAATIGAILSNILLVFRSIFPIKDSSDSQDGEEP